MSTTVGAIPAVVTATGAEATGSSSHKFAVANERPRKPPLAGRLFCHAASARFGGAHDAAGRRARAKLSQRAGGAGAIDAGGEVMMPPWLMRSLRAHCGGLPTLPQEWRGRARFGANAMSPRGSVARARGGPRPAKPSEGNGCAMICATVAGYGKGTIAVLLVRSSCLCALRRPSGVLAAPGIAPSRSRTPRLTSRVGPTGGGPGWANRASCL